MLKEIRRAKSSGIPVATAQLVLVLLSVLDVLGTSGLALSFELSLGLPTFLEMYLPTQPSVINYQLLVVPKKLPLYFLVSPCFSKSVCQLMRMDCPHLPNVRLCNGFVAIFSQNEKLL